MAIDANNGRVANFVVGLGLQLTRNYNRLCLLKLAVRHERISTIICADQRKLPAYQNIHKKLTISGKLLKQSTTWKSKRIKAKLERNRRRKPHLHIPTTGRVFRSIALPI